MNEKEIAELRRRFHPDRSNISAVRGCYVNENGEIVSEFNQSLALLSEAESETFLALLKRTLSGALDKNLLNIEFSTQQVVDGEEHRLLMTLRDSGLQDEEAVRKFFSRVIQSVTMEENYMILLAKDSYDVPYRARDGARLDDADEEVFPYILCAICPVKMAKAALSYHLHENAFRNRMAEQIVSPPELGFLFPAFDDRCANIYGALYYSRNTGDSHPDFVDAVFHSEIPLPAAVQKETFQSMLGSALGGECKYEVVQAVHEQLQEMIGEHKANKEEEPLAVSKEAMKRILAAGEVSEQGVQAFEQAFDQEFGAQTLLAPRNIVDTKKIEVALPDVTIQVSAERGDLVETRVIDGVKYILVRASEGVTLNGVPIHIS